MEYTYPKNYKVKSLTEQVATLTAIFGISADSINPPIEKGEGTFAIPHYKLIAPTYNEAVMAVMQKMSKSRPTYDYRNGNWTEKYLRQLPIKEEFWNKQPKNIVLISAQFGEKYKGKSVESVRKDISDGGLPLGIYEVLIMLLTHPERLQDYNDLYIDCSGDEYSPDADGAFSEAPLLYFLGDEVRFGARDVSGADGDYGSASAFLPQVNLETRPLESFEPLTLESAIKILKAEGYKITKEKVVIEEF